MALFLAVEAGALLASALASALGPFAAAFLGLAGCRPVHAPLSVSLRPFFADPLQVSLCGGLSSALRWLLGCLKAKQQAADTNVNKDTSKPGVTGNAASYAAVASRSDASHIFPASSPAQKVCNLLLLSSQARLYEHRNTRPGCCAT